MLVGLPQSWLLTTEECFYLSAPLAFAALVVALGLGLTALGIGRRCTGCSARTRLYSTTYISSGY